MMLSLIYQCQFAINCHATPNNSETLHETIGSSQTNELIDFLFPVKLAFFHGFKNLDGHRSIVISGSMYIAKFPLMQKSSNTQIFNFLNF